MGVDSFSIELQSNLVAVTGAPDVELDLAAIPAAIARAGFTPADMELVARGRFEEREGRRSFRVRGWTRAHAVDADQALPGGEVELHARVRFEQGELVLAPRQP